jgi:hypothetical protein
MMARVTRASLAWSGLFLVAACDCGSSHGRSDAGGFDAATADAGPVDAAADAGSDAGRPDAGPPDAGPPDAGPPCVGAGTSTLPGVRVEFPPQPCTFTLAEAAAGIDVEYAVVVDAALDEVTARPNDAGGCGTPGDSGLILLERLEGGGQLYCLCDTGLCPGTEVTSDLAAGSYPVTFHWEGRNWMGPSDTDMPMGDPFPPGSYTLTVRANGSYMGTDYEVQAAFPVNVVP